MTLRIRNTTRQTVLAAAADVADTPEKRNTGLLKHTSLPAGEGLLIVPCEGVHTLFMRFPIDVIYIKRNRTVAKVTPAMKPWRLSFCLRAHSVLELPAGTAAETGTAKGDQLEFEEVVGYPAANKRE